MSAVVFWVRTRTRHTPAHVIVSWHNRRGVFMCGNEAEPGGQVISRNEAEQLQLHVCVGCARIFGGRHADTRSLYASHVGGSR